MAQGCNIEESVIGSSYFFRKRRISKVHDYEIKKLSEQFYKDYPHDQYQEILIKEGRSYDVVLFEIDYLADCYVCVPFRTEMKHNNGYKFKFSGRSKKHQSGLDFTKLVIVEYFTKKMTAFHSFDDVITLV